MGGGMSDGTQSSTSTEDLPWIHISGGTILIVNDTGRDADGLDSNGDVVITGGDIRVSLIGDGSNNAIDYASENGGTCTITGGVVVACGGSSMAEGFDSSSTQGSILYSVSETAEAGTMVSLLDANEDELVSYEVPCSFSSVTISCPQMAVGETYTVVVGDSAEDVDLTEVAVTAGDAQSSMYGGGFGQGGGGRNHDAQRMGEQGDASDVDQMGAKPGEAANGGDSDADQMGTESEDVVNNGGSVKPEGAANNGGMGGGNAMPKNNSATSPEERDAKTETDQDDTSTQQTETTAYTTETLVICGISLGILAVGLCVALAYRRRP